MAKSDTLDPQTIRGSKCPSFSEPDFSETRTPIVLDWLTLNVFGCTHIEDLKPGERYLIDPVFYEGRFWKKIYKVVVMDAGKPDVFAELETENREGHYKGWNLRIYNKFLYDSNLKANLKQCFADLNLRFDGISRIDVAIDFQKLNMSVTPSNFIKKCFNGDYLLTGRCKFRPFGDKRTKVQEMLLPDATYAKVSDKVLIEGAVWGLRSSGFQCRMYNKTQEMKNKTFKPWISAQWQAAGMDADQDTWRLEFEVHKKDFLSADIETGELVDSMREIDTLEPQNFEKLTKMLYEKHFKFHRRKVTVNGKRKVLTDRKRRLPSFYPLKLEKAGMQKVPLQRTPESGRSERTEIKKLVKLHDEMKHFGAETTYGIKRGIARQVIKYSCYEWFSREYPDFIDFEMLDGELLQYKFEMTQTQLFEDKKCPVCQK